MQHTLNGNNIRVMHFLVMHRGQCQSAALPQPGRRAAAGPPLCSAACGCLPWPETLTAAGHRAARLAGQELMLCAAGSAPAPRCLGVATEAAAPRMKVKAGREAYRVMDRLTQPMFVVSS